MNILQLSLRVLATATVSVGLVMGGGLAHAAPRSAYPKPVMTYRAHPRGFPDSTEVINHLEPRKPSCKIPLATVTQGDVHIRVRTELVPLVRELMRQTEAKYSYNIRPADTGGFNCRHTRDHGRLTNTVSNHAYGRAVDINWKSNHQSKQFTTNLPPKVVGLWIRHGFYWGGHYKKATPDTMHFEYVGARADIGKYYRAAVKEGGGHTPPNTNCPSATLASYPTLKQSSSGTPVWLAQCKLNTSGASLSRDGVYGPATRAAVVKFQKAHKLNADGVIGTRTWTALLAQGSTPNLHKGSKGNNVTRLQQALRASGQKLDVDGIFGRDTESAVRAYQKRVKLSVDGVVKRETWAALKAGK